MDERLAKHKCGGMSDPGFSGEVVRAAYAAVADEYMASYGDDLAHLELDRHVLDVIAERSPAEDPCLTSGADQRSLLSTSWLDTSTRSRSISRRQCSISLADASRGFRQSQRTSTLFRCGRVRQRRSLPSTSCNTCHADEITTVLNEFHRCLRTDGFVALGVHEGEGEFDVGDVTATLFSADELAQALHTARFDVENIDHREPLSHERQGRRAYLLARAILTPAARTELPPVGARKITPDRALCASCQSVFTTTRSVCGRHRSCASSRFDTRCITMSASRSRCLATGSVTCFSRRIFVR